MGLFTIFTVLKGEKPVHNYCVEQTSTDGVPDVSTAMKKIGDATNLEVGEIEHNADDTKTVLTADLFDFETGQKKGVVFARTPGNVNKNNLVNRSTKKANDDFDWDKAFK